jgi:feruloyl esterase
MRTATFAPLVGLTLLAGIPGCGGGDDDDAALPHRPKARPGTLADCAGLAAKLSYSNTTFTSVEEADAGVLTVAGTPVAAHCRVTGSMLERVSPVDGNTYAIGFEMAAAGGVAASSTRATAASTAAWSPLRAPPAAGR